jgi:hypothetical protein
MVQLMNVIRTRNPDVRFVYLLRPTEDPNTFTFVADADSLNPFPPYFDLNEDGVVDEEDELAPPGTPYDVSEIPDIHTALERTVVLNEPYTDQWGTYISGFGPVKGPDGTAAVLGIDIDIEHYQELSERVFSSALYLLVIFTADVWRCCRKSMKNARAFCASRSISSASR